MNAWNHYKLRAFPRTERSRLRHLDIDPRKLSRTDRVIAYMLGFRFTRKKV